MTRLKGFFFWNGGMQTGWLKSGLYWKCQPVCIPPFQKVQKFPINKVTFNFVHIPNIGTSQSKSYNWAKYVIDSWHGSVDTQNPYRLTSDLTDFDKWLKRTGVRKAWTDFQKKIVKANIFIQGVVRGNYHILKKWHTKVNVLNAALNTNTYLLARSFILRYLYFFKWVILWYRHICVTYVYTEKLSPKLKIKKK